MPFLRAHAFKPRIRQNHIHLSPPPRNATRNAPHIGWTLRAAGRKAEEISSRPLKTKHGHFYKLSLLFKDFLHNPPLYTLWTTRLFLPRTLHLCHPLPRVGPATYPAATAAHGRVRAFRPKRTPLPVRILPCASACPPWCAPYNKKPRLLAGVCARNTYPITAFYFLSGWRYYPIRPANDSG